MTRLEENQNAGEGQPIYTPPPNTDIHWLEPDPMAVKNPAGKVLAFIMKGVRGPADWFRQNIVEPNRGEKYYWYHRKYPRVLPIDECYMDDDACVNEADIEYKRIKKVDRATLDLLKMRRESCYFYYKDERGLDNMMTNKCKEIADTYEREELNYFIKYGEMSWKSNVATAYTKQKHRMIMERRKAQMKRAREEENE